MRKIIIDGQECFINDDEVDEKETGVIIPRDNKQDLEKTIELRPINEKEALENTLVDMKVTEDE